LEELLKGTTGRILQYSRFASDPRFNNYQNNFVSTYKNPNSAQIPFNSVNQGFIPRNNQYQQQNQYNRNPNFNRSSNNSFQSNYAPNQNRYNPNQQFWNQNTNLYNTRPVTNVSPQLSSTSQLKMDGPRRTYYHEIVSYPNGVKRVEYRDMNGQPYVPSFVKPDKPEIPVIDPIKKDDLEPLDEDEEEEEEEKEEESIKGSTATNSNSNQSHLKGRFEDLKGFYFIKENVVEVIKALQYGPVVTAHYVSEAFKFYESGIFNGDGCENGTLQYVNHASVIVGYNLNHSTPYFVLRNSWADDWGEKGYYRMKIGDLTKYNKGICLIAGTPFMVFPYLHD
jgi:hypothetical protein